MAVGGWVIVGMVREKNTAPAILGGSLVIVMVCCSSERPSVLAPLMGRVGLLGGGPGTYYHPFSQIDALITCRSVINSTQVGQHRLSLPCLNWGVPGVSYSLLGHPGLTRNDSRRVLLLWGMVVLEQWGDAVV